MSVTLYYCPKTRALRPRWMLEEIGMDYELKRIDLSKKEHKSPEYLKIHPLGMVPALQDGDQVLFESAGLCAYLADKYGNGRFAPSPDSTDRGEYYQWLFYGMATLEQPVLECFLHSVFLPEEQRSAEVAQQAREKFNGCLQVIEQALAGKTYLVAENFSTADLLIGSILIWAASIKMVGGRSECPSLYPKIKREASLSKSCSRLIVQYHCAGFMPAAS